MTAVFAVLVAASALEACSSPADVGEARRAADAACAALRPLPGVTSASCVVDDGGFDAGIARNTDVELERGVTAAQAHRVITTWLASKDGGLGSEKVGGSRATPLQLTLEAVPDVALTVAPGSPSPGVGFVDEWLSRAERGMRISGSIGDERALRIADEGLPPALQAALLDELSMTTRTDRLILSIGKDSTIQSPVPPSLGATLRGLDAAYLGLAPYDSDRERELVVDVFAGQPPRLWLRVPTSVAPAIPPDRALADTVGWESIRAVLAAMAPGGDAYAVGLRGRPGQVIGTFSTSGCVPRLPGPAPQFGTELQTQWAAIHGVSAPEACPAG
jgi:hypothetical protein